MSFPDYIVKEDWTRSGSRCECTRQGHEHIGRCDRRLLELYRGDIKTVYGWETFSKSGAYLSDPADCEILCWEFRDDIQYL